MASWFSGIPRPGYASLASAAFGCAGIGVLAGIDPAYGLAAAIGIAFTAVVIGDASIGTILFTILSFLDIVNSGGPEASFMKVAGLLLFASYLASAATRNRQPMMTLMKASPTLVIASVVLVSWSAISVVWAGSSGLALTDTYRYLLNVLLIPIVFGTILRKDHLLWLAGAFIVGAVISTIYGFIDPGTLNQPGQLTGTIGDANEQAAVLVGAIALSFGLMGVFRRQPWLRLLGGVAILISIAGVVNTLSRSGLIALAAMLIAGVIYGGRWRRWATPLLIVGVVGGVIDYVAFAPSTTKSRITSSDTSGRSTIWAVAWRMVEAHPLIGVGSGNFSADSVNYVQDAGPLTRADLIVDDPKVAHNIYLEVLADMGIVGLLAFLGIVGGAVAAAARAAQAFRLSGEQDLELMSRCVIFAIVGFMVSDFFLSGEFSKQLWLVLALGPTLLALSRRTAEDDVVETSPGAVPRSRRALAAARP